MNTQKALQEIRQQNIKPLYLILGTETYLQEQVRSALLEKLQIGSSEDLNYAVFDMAETSIETVIDEAETLPFFGDQRLIFVEDPFFFTGEKRSGSGELNTDALLAYLQDPLESTVLVFFAPYEKLDERKKITKELKKRGTVIDVNPPDEAETRRYLQQLFENEEIQYSREAFDLFLRLTDANLTKIVSEFQKLALFVGRGGKVEAQLVHDLIPKTLEHNIFEMTSYVLSGKAAAALRLFDDLLLQGEETIKINAILISQLRLLLQTKILTGIGYQQSNIASTLNIHPYRVKLAMKQVRSFPVKQLAAIFDELVENDYLIKTGQVDKNLLFQLFVLKVAAAL